MTFTGRSFKQLIDCSGENIRLFDYSNIRIFGTATAESGEGGDGAGDGVRCWI